jgi:23S rRNA (uracil-5-)-methyltransferase RumA
MIHTDYKGQVRMKEHYLEETLKKYADYSGPIEPLIKNPEPLAYRNSCKLPVAMVDGVLKSGMYVRNTNDFVPLDRCLIHSQTLEKTRTEIMDILNKHGMQAYAKGRRGGLKTLVMKEFDGKVQVVLVTYLGQEISPELAADIMNLEPVVSLWQSIKQNQESDVEVFGKVMRHIAGDEKIPVQLDDIQLELLPRSFFQLNTKQAETLYKKVADIMPASKLVVEAYSGIGGIAFAAAKKADKIIGIEAVADAVENAKANSENNHIENVEFLCGDAAEELENIADNEDVDTLIVDPPRSGLGERMIEAIKFSQPKNIVYVSCNPSTLAKDIAELSAYEIAYVQPLDMFSQTPHVETICLLKQKKASADKGEE